MDIIKPEPLHLGDRYFYTLSSYDPVSIEVQVPRVTETDVDIALMQLATEREYSRETEAEGELDATTPLKVPETTDAWVAENFPELGTVDALRDALRHQLEQMNSQMAEESKATRCAEQLAKRLCQSVPEAELARARAMIEQSMAADLAAEGMTVSDFMVRSGLPRMSLDTMLDTQAKAMCEQDAAVDAFAQERKLKVEDGELARFLGVPLAQAQQVLDEARAAGQVEYLRQAAVRIKAMRIIVAEASCTYVQESLEDAEKRSAQYLEMLTHAPMRLDADVVEGGAPASDGPAPTAAEKGFKLV